MYSFYLCPQRYPRMLRAITLFISFVTIPLLIHAPILSHVETTTDCLTFKQQGQELTCLDITQIEYHVAETEVFIQTPLPHTHHHFKGFYTYRLLDIIYGENWKEYQAVEFMQHTGEITSIPVQQLIKYQSALVYQSLNSSTVPTKIKPIPFNLVWNNIGLPHTVDTVDNQTVNHVIAVNLYKS